jgi:hypothetical protein
LNYNDKSITLGIEDLRSTFRFVAGGTAYPPLPIEPYEGNSTMLDGAGPRPTPASAPSGPRPAPSPGGPAYPSLPLEPDTKDDKPGERK